VSPVEILRQRLAVYRRFGASPVSDFTHGSGYAEIALWMITLASILYNAVTGVCLFDVLVFGLVFASMAVGAGMFLKDSR